MSCNPFLYYYLFSDLPDYFIKSKLLYGQFIVAWSVNVDEVRESSAVALIIVVL